MKRLLTAKIYVANFVVVVALAWLISMAHALDCDQSYPCESSMTPKSCRASQFLEIDSSRSCCPTCRGGLGFGVSGCNPRNSRRRCAPGLRCTNGVCQLDKDSCSFTYHLRHLRNLPDCEIYGSFAAKQCRGDMLSGRCFCSDERGNRIFGFEWRKDAADMTCACSRRRSQIAARGRHDATLHCTPNGNFERLQCDDGICWCASPMTGQLDWGTRAVGQALWKTLPCYDPIGMGTEYLRQCESAAYAQQLVLKALDVRGTRDVALTALQCDFDGSFGVYKIENGIAACTWRDGKRIGSFQDGASQVSRMDCLCARDSKIFAEAGLQFTLSCLGNGNYDAIQSSNSRRFCVDRDGFPLTDYIRNQTLEIDCRKFMYQLVTEPEDDD